MRSAVPAPGSRRARPRGTGTPVRQGEVRAQHLSVWTRYQHLSVWTRYSVCARPRSGLRRWCTRPERLTPESSHRQPTAQLTPLKIW